MGSHGAEQLINDERGRAARSRPDADALNQLALDGDCHLAATQQVLVILGLNAHLCADGKYLFPHNGLAGRGRRAVSCAPRRPEGPASGAEASGFSACPTTARNQPEARKQRHAPACRLNATRRPPACPSFVRPSGQATPS